jgi:hypothetical protein
MNLRSLRQEVRAQLERGYSELEIAHKLCVTIAIVRSIHAQLTRKHITYSR